MEILQHFTSFLFPLFFLVLNKSKYTNPFYLYVAVGTATEFTSVLDKDIFQNEISYLFSTFAITTYATFETTTYYSYLIRLGNRFKKLYQTFFLISISVSILTGVFFDPEMDNMWPYAILSLFLMIMGLLGYYDILFKPTILNPLKSSFFWINSAFFLYGAGSTIIFLYIDPGLKEERPLMANLWYIGFGLVNALRYLFIAIGVYQKDMIN